MDIGHISMEIDNGKMADEVDQGGDKRQNEEMKLEIVDARLTLGADISVPDKEDS